MVSHERKHIIYALLSVSIILFLVPSSLVLSIQSNLDSFFSPVEKHAYKFFGVIRQKTLERRSSQDIVKENKNLKEENEKIKNELSALQADTMRLKYLNQEIAKFDNAYGARIPEEHQIYSHVISRNTGKYENIISIDKGYVDGVKEKYGVIVGSNVVGEVISVGARASRVRLITDPQIRIDSKMQKTRQRVIIMGHDEVLGELKIIYHPIYEKVQEGDIVETSGMNGYFFPGIKIGEVSKVKKLKHEDEDLLFLDIDVSPAADFDKLETVIVIKPYRTEEERINRLNNVLEQ